MPKRSGTSAHNETALVLSPECPYPVMGGGPMRTASVIEYLQERYNIDLVVFHEAGAADPRDHIPRDLVRRLLVIDLPRHSRNTLLRAARNARRYMRGVPPLVDRFSGFGAYIAGFVQDQQYAATVVEHFWAAPYAPYLRNCSRRLVLNLHNVESELLDRCSRAESGPTAMALRRFAERCSALEEQWLPAYDDILTASRHDAAKIAGSAGQARVTVCPNAIPFREQRQADKRNEIVFSGNLEYQPNLQAVEYFHSRIWPLLREAQPALVLVLAGRNQRRLQRRIGHDVRVRFTGPYEDALEMLAPCKAAIAPLVSGSGTRVKILEAWAAGTAVISTRLGAEGLDCHNGEDLLLADGEAEFAGAVSSVLTSADLRTRLERSGRNLYEREYTWSAVREILTGISL